jgi:hypothetical protein
LTAAVFLWTHTLQRNALSAWLTHARREKRMRHLVGVALAFR